MTGKVRRAGADEQGRDYRVRADSAGAGRIPDQPGDGSRGFSNECFSGDAPTWQYPPASLRRDDTLCNGMHR